MGSDLVQVSHHHSHGFGWAALSLSQAPHGLVAGGVTGQVKAS
jgi:hypothetical protein